MNKIHGWWTALFFALAVTGLAASVYCFYQARALESSQTTQRLLVSKAQVHASRLRAYTSTGGLISDAAVPVEQIAGALSGLSNSVVSGSALAEAQQRASSQYEVLLQLLAESESAERDIAQNVSAQSEQMLIPPPAVPVAVPQVPDFEPLILLSSELRETLLESDAPDLQAESAGHLYQLAVSVDRKIAVSPDGTVDSVKARGPWMVFNQILKRMESMVGDAEIPAPGAIELVTNIRAQQVSLAGLFDGSFNERVLQHTEAQSPSPNAEQELLLAQEATLLQQKKQRQIDIESEFTGLDESLESAGAALSVSNLRASSWFTFGLMTALLSAGILALLALGLWRAQHKARSRQHSIEQEQQASILRLLDEISALAEGDLETRATVSEDMTGAIADCFNYAVGELRRLVGAINQSADRVSAAVEDTGATAQQLANASSMQSREISRSSSYLKAMSDTMGQISQRSTEAVDIATRSVDLSESGKQAVDSTINGVKIIETRTADNLKMMKRLSDSSEQIGRAVTLMNEVAERTELLAMNAAIQSRQRSEEASPAADKARSAEAPPYRQSARVADQIQGLAATLNHTSLEVDSLISLIRCDISDSIGSMERTVSEVRGVSELSQHAGTCLTEIEQVSNRLSMVVEHLGARTTRQSEVVTKLASNMGVINEVTRHSAHGLRLSASALEDLKLMSTELRDSVADFSLPSNNAEPSNRSALSRRGARVLEQNPGRRSKETEGPVLIDMDSDKTQVVSSVLDDSQAAKPESVERDT